MKRAFKNRMLLVAAIFITATCTSIAQATFMNVPKDTLADNILLGSAKVLDFKQQHLFPDTLFLAWKQVSITLPSQWEAYLCDNGNCYTILPDSGVMSPVPDGDYGLLSLHIVPKTNYGTAIIRYAVWDVKHASIKDTLTWVINSNTSGVVTVSEGTPQVYSFNKKLYVNTPAFNIRHITLYAITGQLLFQKNLDQQNDIIDLTYLNDGVYIVIVTTNTANILNKIHIAKQD